MIEWLLSCPSPQSTPILNSLSQRRDFEVSVRAVYRTLGDSGRGWGPLALEHTHRLVPRRNSLIAGYCDALRPEVSGAVVQGYSDPYFVGYLLGLRKARKPVLVRSDSTLHRRSKWWRRALRSLAIPVLHSKATTRSLPISLENEEFWARYKIPSLRHIPFESPLPTPDDWPRCRQETRAALGIGGDDEVVLFVGRVTAEKGIRETFAAQSELLRRKMNSRLIVVGPVSLSLADLDVPERTTLLGAMHREQLSRVMIAADVLVLLSHSEPYGLVVREALQFGLPVVASTGVPSVRALCDLGWNVVDAKDPSAVADGLEKAIARGRWGGMPPVDVSDDFVQAIALWTIRT